MIKKIILVSFTLFLLYPAVAQQDKVYFKNGSLLKGQISKSNHEDTLLLEVEENTFRVPLSLIEEFKWKSGLETIKYKSYSFPKGWQTSLEASALLGKHNDDDRVIARPSLSIAQLYQFSSLMTFGASAGFQSYDDYNVFPITFNYQGIIGRSRKGLVVFGKLGQSITQDKTEPGSDIDIEIESGLNYAFGIGYQQRSGSTGFQIRLGYTTQYLTRTREVYEGYWISNDRRLNRITTGLIIFFNY